MLEGTSEERYAGVVRTDQNWIGGRGLSPADAEFIPPPEDEVPRLLADLVAFLNRDDLPAVAARYDVTPTAARGALNRLEETGVLVTTRVGRIRNREWISDELFQVLDAYS